MLGWTLDSGIYLLLSRTRCTSGEPCFPYPFSDGSLRCGPEFSYVPPEGYGRLYADAACTQILAEFLYSCPEFAAAGLVEEGCSPAIEPRAIGAGHSAQVYRDDPMGGCAAIPSDPNMVYRLVGEPLPFDQFALVETATLP